ncbi:hypothetical protein HPB51_012521 [Rhipicephalus microplus]|uniref:BTB domain-containing protein n=1 Tax=Rhipicephalus microplus TaxID=6941 RepID=A0A9J6DGU7_RHIMP|nr:hypothetical protein HPB51_012521 [Rhipicephalus microplus]
MKVSRLCDAPESSPISPSGLCQQRPGQALLSSAFSGGDDETVTWRLKLFPRGSDERHEQFVSVFLVSCNTRCVSARARFSVIDAQEQVAIRKCTEMRMFKSKGDGWGFGILVARLALKQNSSHLLPNDTLTLKCEVVALESSTPRAPGTSGEMALPALPKCRLSDDLEWLLESGSHTDVTLIVGSETFLAHKSILAARSPVFQEMFEHTTMEDDEVVIADVEPDVFADLLLFVYTGCVQESIRKPDCLLRAACKYKLDRLKQARLAEVRGSWSTYDILHKNVKTVVAFDDSTVNQQSHVLMICTYLYFSDRIVGVSDFSQAPATRKAADAGNNDPYVGGGWHNSETGQVLSNYMTWQRPFAVGFGYLSEG